MQAKLTALLKDKRIVYGLIAAAAVALLAVGYFAVFGDSLSVLGGDSVNIVVLPTDHVRGAPNAPITIVEYASMTCPHCADFERETMPQLVMNYVDTGKVRLIFREFPLDGAARIASALALCVPEDKYFSFIDLIFLHQSQWLADLNNDQQVSFEEAVEGLVQMGRFAGFSREKVESCIADKASLDRIDKVQAEAERRYGVNSTPTFIIQGKIHVGEISYADLDKILQPLLARK